VVTAVPTRVLLVDDNPQDRLLTRRALAAEFPDLELAEVANAAQLEAALGAPAFDVVITDYQLRWSDGLKVFEQIQTVAPGVPVIMFTNTGSEEIAASALRMHLADYIVKIAGHYGRLAHGVRVALHNAAERDRVESQLQERSQLLDLSHEPIFAWDRQGGITEWNAGCERLYGYSRQEALGRVSHELLQTQYPVPLPHVLEMLATRREWSGELQHHARDGREILVESRWQMFDMGDRSIVLESDHDVTLQKRAAERAAFMNQVGNALAGSLDYETTLAAVANLAVPVIADWCAVDILEDAKLQRLAVAHSDPAKIELARGLQRYDDPASPHSARTVARTGTPVLVPFVTDEMIATAAKGDEERIRLVQSLGLVSYMCVPLIAHGRTLGALTLATADSGRRYTDEDLRFGQDVAHRAALAVENARAYLAMQVADRLKDEFLATLSHELRTPLNAIIGYARLLRSGSVRSDRAQPAIEIIERNAAALTHLVEDLLDVSRIISGKVRLNIQPVDLPTVVRAAVDSIRPAADAKQLRVQVTTDPDAAPIAGDPDRLQQIVWNLVSNSVKFTPKAGRIQVRLERIDSHVDITVSDTGVGISPDVLPHVFERFRQGDSATTRQFGGLGLGLAIVRHLVELHGGTVHATSSGADQGSTFRVRLPLMIVHHQSAVDERRRHASSSRILAPTPGKLSGVHVLAVDDDGDALSLVREVLEIAGARVTTVDGALAALDLVRAVKPSVLVADIGLRELDGYELIRRIRQLDDAQLRSIPAIALTAYARAEDRVKALETGFEMHLAKPADPAELVAAVLAAARRER
jgi:PAS domain S-box-containing protein